MLTSVSARSTFASRADASVYWVGPGLDVGRPPGGDASSFAVSLTLVGCTFGGPRFTTPDVPTPPNTPPSGAVIASKFVFLVADAGVRVTYPTNNVLYSYDHLSPTPDYNPVPVGGDPVAFDWYKTLR